MRIERPKGREGRRISRRTVLGTGLAAGAALVLGGAAGCGGKSLVGGGLRFWNGFTGPDGRAMLGILRGFNDAFPDLPAVTMQRLDWATYYSKLFVAGLGGRSPEIFVLHREHIPRFANAGLLRPVDDLVGPDKPIAVDVADFDPNVWDAVRFGGHRYALPLDVHPMGMFYNRALFERAGIDAPPVDGPGFLETLRALKAHAVPGGWPTVYADGRNTAFTLMRQFGGHILGRGGEDEAVALDSPANRRAWQWLSDLIREGLAPSPTSYEAWVGFKQGRVGLCLHGIYMIGDLDRQGDLDWAAAPVPTVGPKAATWADSHCLCLRPDLEGEGLAGACALLTYLSDHSLDWAEAGQVPVRRSLRRTERFAAMKAQSAFASQIPVAQYLPAVPYIGEVVTVFDYAVERALRGSLSPGEALASADAEVRGIVARSVAEGAGA